MAAALRKQGETALLGLSSIANDLSTMLTKSLSALPSDMSKQYLASFSKNDFSNAALKATKGKVEDYTAQTIEILATLQTWIQLLVPKVEDGGNFGVAIQMQIIKVLSDQNDKIVKVFDDIAMFHEKRGAIVEKISPKTSIEEKTSNVTKSIEEGKTGESKSSSETMTKAEPLDEQLEALAALDVKLYIQLKNSVRMQRDFLVFVADFIEKNAGKLKDPRGNATSSYSY